MNRPLILPHWIVTVAVLSSGPRLWSGEPLRYEPKETHLPATPVAVPMELVDRLPLVQVKINGQGPYLFILDTGASLVALNKPLAGTLKLRPDKSAAVGDSTGEGGRTVNVVDLQTLELGEARFAGVEAVVVDLGFVVGGHRTIDGLLSFGLFADCLLTLDYPASAVTLERGKLLPDKGQEVLRYMKVEGFPRLTLRLADRTVHLTVDSGSNGCLTLPRSLRQSLTFHAPPVAMGRVQRTQTDQAAELARVVGPLKIGRHVVADPLVRLLGNSGIVGNQILQHFAVTFDQKNAYIRFARQNAEPITIPPVRSRGFYTEERDGVLVVVEVIAGTEAARLGVKVGDRIMRVDDRPFAEVGREAWATLWNGDQPLRLTLQRRKETYDITVPMVELVP
ncbi:MAG: aspartyl protease family protein [Planctomycetota bacterium]